MKRVQDLGLKNRRKRLAAPQGVLEVEPAAEDRCRPDGIQLDVEGGHLGRAVEWWIVGFAVLGWRWRVRRARVATRAEARLLPGSVARARQPTRRGDQHEARRQHQGQYALHHAFDVR